MRTPTQNRMTSARRRSARDFYETPYELCFMYLRDRVAVKKEATFLDPGAGNGIWGKAIKDLFPQARMVGLDINTEEPMFSEYYDDWYSIDYLSYSTSGRFDYIVGNPPYSQAEPFIRHSYELLARYGEIHFLLPLAFLGSKKRMNGLFQDLTPSRVTVSAKRPSFFSSIDKKTGNIKEHSTDAIEYAMFKWEKPGENSYPIIKWFDWSYE